ncbi:MAG: tRNA 2-thiouridine(34) synthase MnmA [Chloroflexi bacterium]|nr:tRNA 2-thiouridine(34) synthase MnmA [Chloroflexota bacterium]
MNARVVVAMSGGVDSSVAAALLKEQGYEVIGMMLRLWTEPGRETANRCCTPEAMALARRVASQLEIPFYVVDAKDAFAEQVVTYFINEYMRGVTPNPCMICNRHIRWEFLLNRALSLGAEFMATGHYACLERDAQGRAHLFRANDQHKDQSYVLHALDPSQLDRALFPIGELTKSEVRQKAAELNLPVAHARESQDLCFLAGTRYEDFLKRNAPNTASPGAILDSYGNLLGQHAGLPFYTIGQRKGLGISSAEPLYVLEKDIASNTLRVGPADDLGCHTLTASEMNWLQPAPVQPFRALVKTRYTAPPRPATVSPDGPNRFIATFDDAVRDITPGQAAVIYLSDEVLGGGIIETQVAPAAARRRVNLLNNR